MQEIKPAQLTNASNPLISQAFIQVLDAEQTKEAKALLIDNPSLIKRRFLYGSLLRTLLISAEKSENEENFYDLIQFVIEKDPSQISEERGPDALWEVVGNLYHNKKRPFFQRIFSDLLSTQPHCTDSSLKHSINLLSSEPELFALLEQFVALQPKVHMENAILSELPTIIKSACDQAFYLLLSPKYFDLNLPTNFGWTALHIAARIGTDQRITWILENGGDLHITTPDGANYETILTYNALDAKLSESSRNYPQEDLTKYFEEVITTPGYLSQPDSVRIKTSSIFQFIKSGIEFNNPHLPYFFLITCEHCPAYSQRFLTELLQCASAYGGESIETDNTDLAQKWCFIGLKLIKMGAQSQDVVFTDPELPEPMLGGIPVLVRERVGFCETFINTICASKVKSAASPD